VAVAYNTIPGLGSKCALTHSRLVEQKINDNLSIEIVDNDNITQQ